MPKTGIKKPNRKNLERSAGVDIYSKAKLVIKQPPKTPKKVVLETEAEAIAFGEDMVDFVKREDVLFLCEFLEQVEHHQNWLDYQIKLFPALEKYRKRAKRIIGSRLIRIAVHNGNLWAIKTYASIHLEEIREHALDTARKMAEIEAEVKQKYNQSSDTTKILELLDELKHAADLREKLLERPSEENTSNAVQ